MPVETRMGAAFELHFGNIILEKMATMGRLDGQHPSLACATAGGRIMVHTVRPKEDAKPEQLEDTEEGVQFLNYSKTPTALLMAPITGETSGDYLIIGSQTSLTAYNLLKNTEAFYKEVQDGVSAVTFGFVTGQNGPITVAGGNCSLVGFDRQGEDVFWTVTGDVVTALAATRWTEFNAIIAGGEDYEISIFRGEEVAATITEADRIKLIAATQRAGKYAVALGNGTVGYYTHCERQWRFKSKHQCTALGSCDVDFDGVEEILCGWSNGKFDIRSDIRRGEAIFKEMLGCPVSAIVTGDYRQTGRNIPLVCAHDGCVRGYIALETSAQDAIEERDRGLLEDLMKERQALQVEVATLAQQIEKNRKGEGDTTLPSTKVSVSCKLRPNVINKCVEIIITATEGVIQSAVVTGELVFDGNESALYYTKAPSETLVCPISTEKDVATTLKVACMVGMPMSEVFQVHDLTIDLPKFAMFIPVRELQRLPAGYVTGPLPDRVQRFQSWVSTAFNVPAVDVGQSFSASFVSVRDGSQIHITASTQGESAFTIRCDSIDICCELVQDIVAYFGLKELQTTCDFPQEMDKFKDVLRNVEEYNAVRMKLTAEMADSTQLVKNYVIRAEDARILMDMRFMKKMYSALYEINRELMGEYMKRNNNHTELMAALKIVNNMIQKGANLRAGPPKNAVVTGCRAAIKTMNVAQLIKIIQTGTI